MQGRWGLTGNDCDPTRDDHKGLMVVGPSMLTFYESRAEVAVVMARGAGSITARFDFAGEGQTWERTMTLEARDGGMILIRTDRGKGGPADPLRYMNCEAV